MKETNKMTGILRGVLMMVLTLSLVFSLATVSFAAEDGLADRAQETEQQEEKSGLSGADEMRIQSLTENLDALEEKIRAMEEQDKQGAMAEQLTQYYQDLEELKQRVGALEQEIDGGKVDAVYVYAALGVGVLAVIMGIVAAVSAAKDSDKGSLNGLMQDMTELTQTLNKVQESMDQRLKLQEEKLDRMAEKSRTSQM